MAPEVVVDADGRYYHAADGKPLYPARYRPVNLFAEGLAVVHCTRGGAALIDESERELDLGDWRFAWILPSVGGRLQTQTHDGRDGSLDGCDRFHAHRQDMEWTTRVGMVRIARLIYERGYNISINGNLSVRLADELLMTSSGCHLGFLQPEDLSVTNLASQLVRGTREPTSEYHFHTALYAQRSEIRCMRCPTSH